MKEHLLELVANVKAGKIPGWIYESADWKRCEAIASPKVSPVAFVPQGQTEWSIVAGSDAIVLCHDIRTTVKKMGYRWDHTDHQFTIVRDVAIRTMPKHFKGGSDLGRHIQALNYVASLEVTA